MASVVSSTDEVATQLIGTWKLTSWVTQVIGEDSREPYGPNPKGRLVITPEGHWIVIITAANRQSPKTSDEKAALLDSMRAIVERAMEDGAIGLSTGLYYAPGSYA